MTPDTPSSALESLRYRRIFFGHQSVGANILDGIGRLDREHPSAGLRIVESTDPADYTRPVFGHARIGVNRQPLGKIDFFADVLRGGLVGKTEIALMKLCYVDVTRDTDIDSLLAHYRQTMASLRAEFPATVLVHVTVPVTVMPPLHHRLLGTLLRRHNRAADDNLARTEYNRRLIGLYAGREPVFDLAGAESVFPSGRQNRFTSDGREFRALVRRYSSDGRHLSEQGRRVVAAALLGFLARLETPGPARVHRT
jgi:hypothetical protein